MDVVISNVGCGILASLIYDVSKICLGKFYHKNDEMMKIEELIKENLGNEYEILYMSGEFVSFLKAPFFRDTIENYIIYKITGNYEGDLTRIKRSNNIIVEKDIIDFLCDYLFKEYNNKEMVTKPSKSIVRQFFGDFFKLASNYIVSLLKNEDKMDMFFINSRIDYAQESILLRLDETIETIIRTMKCEIIPVESEYEDYAKQYHNILKSNNSRAHVYLLDTFDFAQFYVPPFLRQVSPGRKMREHIRWMRRDYLVYASGEKKIEKDDYFDDWKYIFDCSSIVYVTGGAGYGKSLFLKKIINDFNEMNILNSLDYLVIYGDLNLFMLKENIRFQL